MKNPYPSGPGNVIHVPVIKAHNVKHPCHNKDAKVAAFASLCHCQLESFCEITWISDVKSVPFAVLDQTALDYARYMMNVPDDTALNQVGSKRQW